MEKLKRMRNATLAQIGAAVAGLGVGLLTGNYAGYSEAGHSTHDIGSHGIRYWVEKKGFDQDSLVVKALLNSTIYVPAGILALTAYKAGIDINAGKIPEGNPAVYMTGAAVIGLSNTYSRIQLSQINGHSHASHLSYSHSKGDEKFSWALATGLATEAVFNNGTSNWAALTVGPLAAGYLLSETKHDHQH